MPFMPSFDKARHQTATRRAVSENDDDDVDDGLVPAFLAAREKLLYSETQLLPYVRTPPF